MSNTISHTDPLLTTHNLAIGYHEGRKLNSLLENLDLTLHQGELVCFMGPNGIGKSTLIRTLAGIQKPISGKLHYSQDGEMSAKVSVVLTDRITAMHLSVYELIMFGRYPYLDWTIKISDNDKRIVDQSIESIGINHLIEKKLYQLSDGQLQMVMIARALAQDAPVILLDEPTAHLDLNNRVEIMRILRKLSHQFNKAILVATHELDLALQTADLIWLAGNNKDIRTGIPEDLVLNGSFDEIFQFKGFDLKTGKMQQDTHRGIAVQLIAEGHVYRWTKNALERSGFAVADEAEIIIQTSIEIELLTWSVTKKGETFSFTSLASLVNSLV